MPRRRTRHSRIGALTVALLLCGSVVAISHPAHADDAPQPAATAWSEGQTALQQAKDSGSPVTVDADTTETTQTVANPDGTFTLTSNATPVRVQQAGGWVPIDTTLVPRPDGSYAPKAATDDVTFSGGGDGPILTLNNGPSSVSFNIAPTLPAPVIDGATATYPSVLPGVDLVLTAEPTSFSEVFVVHDADAAANPELSTLEISASTVGTELSQDNDGGLTGVSDDGTVLFHGSPPIMWDSTDNPELGPAPTASDPGGATPTLIPTDVTAPQSRASRTDDSSSATVTLNPPVGALLGPDVTYPVYVDPTLTTEDRTHFAVVFSGGWHYYDDTSNDLKVGDCDWPGCDGIGVGRTYLKFDTTGITSPLDTAQISSAEFDAYEIHNAGDCTAEPVDLYTSGDITSSTTWPGPIGTYLDEETSKLGDSCSGTTAGYVSFTSGDLEYYLQQSADNDTTATDFALRAPSESNALEWKRFASSVTGMKLIVTYSFPPSRPTALQVAGEIDCWSGHHYSSDLTPRLEATSTDYDTPPLPLKYWFDLYKVDGPGYASRWNNSAVNFSSGTLGYWDTNSAGTNNTDPINEGDYYFTVYASNYTTDGSSASGPSATSPGTITFDATAPNTPTITSLGYPEGTWGNPANDPTTMTFTSSSSDVAGFTYDFDNTGEPSITSKCPSDYTTGSLGGIVAAKTDGSDSQTITLPTTLDEGEHTVTVKAFDRAHNLSGESLSYSFYVAPNFGQSASGLHQAEAAGFTSTGSLTTTALAGDQYSGGAAVQLNGDSSASLTSPESFSTTFATPVDGDYAIGVELVKNASYGQLEFQLNGTPLTLNDAPLKVNDFASSERPDYAVLGGTYLKHAAVNTFTVSIVGKVSGASGYNAGIDYVRAVPLTDTTVSTLADARNNHGIRGGTPAADFGPSSSALALSATDPTISALQGTGFSTAGISEASGSTSGKTYNLPSTPTAAGWDNVIADSQNIQEDDAAHNYIDLLVASTCGSTAATANTGVIINYDGGATSTTSLLPAVPDATGAPVAYSGHGTVIEPVAAVAYYDGSTVSSTPLELYEIQVPVGRSTTAIHSITLPNYGGDFTDDCLAPNLHVLAITSS